jgi:hypothetical protein
MVSFPRTKLLALLDEASYRAKRQVGKRDLAATVFPDDPGKITPFFDPNHDNERGVEIPGYIRARICDFAEGFSIHITDEWFAYSAEQLLKALRDDRVLLTASDKKKTITWNGAVQAARKIVSDLESFSPDVIVAFNGGSALFASMIATELAIKRGGDNIYDQIVVGDAVLPFCAMNQTPKQSVAAGFGCSLTE